MTRKKTWIYQMFNDAKHELWVAKEWNETPRFIKRDKSIYEYRPLWYQTKDWLLDKGFKECDFPTRACYVPIASIDEDGTHIGYTLDVNLSDKILKDKYMARRYSSVYWVDLGKCTYPKYVRSNLSVSYLAHEWNRSCDKLIIPNSDPIKFFLPLSKALP